MTSFIVQDGYMTYTAEVFNLLNLVLEDRRLSTLVEAIELGEVVDLDIVDYARS